MRNTKLIKVISVMHFLIFIVGSHTVEAGGGPEVDRVFQLEQKVELLEKQLHDLKSELTTLKSKKHPEKVEVISEDTILDGLQIGLGATGIYQATSGANGDDIADYSEDVNDVSYSVDLEMEKAFGHYALGYLHLEAGGGETVEDELKVFSNVNRDSDNDENVRLTEVYYEHHFSNVFLTITGGKIDATAYIDTNEYANDEATQFLGRIFRNSPAIDFADNAAGARFLFEPDAFWNFEYVAMDSESDFEDFFDQLFMGWQITLKPDLLGRSGNYRLIGWTNDRVYRSWTDQMNTKESAWGLGLSIDQEIADSIGVFGRYAWRDEEYYLDGDEFSLEQSYSVGFNFAGDIWNRSDDVLGAAFGQVFASDDYASIQGVDADTESHLEVYYSLKLNEHLTISPDLQVIWDPFGGDAANGSKAITVYGMRGQLDF